MKHFSTIEVNGRSHVICPKSDRGAGIKKADYQETGMALCGVIQRGQTLKQWVKKHGHKFTDTHQ